MLKVEEKLLEAGISYRLIPLNEKAFTVADVLKFSNDDLKPEEVCKTIILIGKKTDKRVGVLLRGVDRLNFSEAKKIFGEEMGIASPEVVKEVSGVEPGAVCPLMLEAPLFIDQKVLDLKRINCGSGDHLQGLEFQFEDMRKVISYTVENLAKI